MNNSEPNLPTICYSIAGIITAKGYDKGSQFILSEPHVLPSLNAAYTEQNLEGHKGLLI